jgi:tRNA A37 threonylcarbamoyladenosine biosynthesis protein TsaE
MPFDAPTYNNVHFYLYDRSTFYDVYLIQSDEKYETDSAAMILR